MKEEFEINFEDKDGDGVDDRLVFYTRVLTMAKIINPQNFSPTHIFWLVRAIKYFPDLAVGVAKAEAKILREDSSQFNGQLKRFSQFLLSV